MTHRPVKQRPELTHRHNRTAGRHGWLRLTPAYSVHLVSNILAHYDQPVSVLDPFSGTGTTVLAAAELGHNAVGVDINPFLVWLGNTKLAAYSAGNIAAASAAVGKLLTNDDTPPVEPPPIHNIERWWDPEVLRFLCALRARIRATARAHTRTSDLLNVIFCQTVIKLSHAAFNHQSMSFARDDLRKAHTPEACAECFRANARVVLESARPNPIGAGRLVLGDSRTPPPAAGYGLVLSSPPYPNRISYVRELRPYMYWLGYIDDAKEAGELDWRAIGGSWGIATSRLSAWKPEPHAFIPRVIKEVVERIRDARRLNGGLLAAYVHKYFCDMWEHFRSVKQGLTAGAKVVYIVGNSTFYGVLVPTQEVYAEMLGMAGFLNVRVDPIRKRNSKKELFEYAVEADYAVASPLGPVAAIPYAHAKTVF